MKANPLILLVGTEGFEPSTPCTPCKCATRLRYAPKEENYNRVGVTLDSRSLILTSSVRNALSSAAVKRTAASGS